MGRKAKGGAGRRRGAALQIDDGFTGINAGFVLNQAFR
jgi:hypothetical protein